MDKNQQSFLKSFRRIGRLYDKKKDTIDSYSEAIGPEITILKSIVDEIDILKVEASIETKEITRLKEKIKELLISYCLQLNNGLLLYIRRVIKDSLMEAKVSYTISDLNAPDEVLPAYARSILEVADEYIPLDPVPTPEDPNPTPLPNPVKKYGATPRLVKQLRDTLALFEQKSPEARDVEKDIKGINESMASKFESAKNIVQNLRLMFSASFLTNDPLLYDSWLRASRPDDPKTMHTRIGGTIKDAATGVGIRYVKVNDKATGSTYKTKSLPGGSYSLVVPLGTYNLEFTKNGYVTQQETVSVEEEGRKTRLDVMLVPVV